MSDLSAAATEDIPVSKTASPGFGVSLLTGGIDRPYAFGLSMALAGRGLGLEVVGNSEVDSPEMHSTPAITFRSLYWEPQATSSITAKILRVVKCYVRLIRYAAGAQTKIFHILWNNKVHYFDRTILMLYYKFMGKKVVFTAHNVNAGQRDGRDSLLNRLTLRMQYKLADHIFVHTDKMRDELLNGFGVSPDSITVIPFGVNNSVPDTNLTYSQARQRLGIEKGMRTILFFGAVRQYKGLEYLVDAFRQLKPGNHCLLIAGEPKKGTEQYVRDIQQVIRDSGIDGRVIQKLQFIPDEETELYFKAADVCALPYTDIFQSGVLFLSYSFGLPVIATDVGSFPEDVDGETGLLCRARDAGDLARALGEYFEGDLYRGLADRRQVIRERARSRNSWDVVGKVTSEVYRDLLGLPQS